MEPYLIVGEGKAGIAPVVIPLSDVLEMHRVAQQLVMARFSGDPQAEEMVQEIFSLARRQGAPGKAHAYVSTFLIRDAVEQLKIMQAAQAQAEKARATQAAQAQTQAQAQAAQAPAPSPKSAAPAPPQQQTQVAGAPAPKCKHPSEFTCAACAPH